MTSGFFDPPPLPREPSPAADCSHDGGDLVMGAFVRDSAPAKDAMRMLSECRASRDSYRDWADRVGGQRLRPESSSSSAPEPCVLLTRYTLCSANRIT